MRNVTPQVSRVEKKKDQSSYRVTMYKTVGSILRRKKVQRYYISLNHESRTFYNVTCDTKHFVYPITGFIQILMYLDSFILN